MTHRLFGEDNVTVKEQEAIQRVVILGDCCINRIQLDYFFTKNSINLEYTHLFDWLAVTSIEKLSQAINNSLKNIAEIKLAELKNWISEEDYQRFRRVSPEVWPEDINKALSSQEVCDNYGMLYLHVAQKFNVNIREGGSISGRIRPELFEKDYPNIKSKLDYLRDKTIKALKDVKKTLYVMCGPVWGKKSDFTLDNIIKIKDAILSANPKANFKILVVVTLEDGREHEIGLEALNTEHIIIRQIKLTRAYTWCAVNPEYQAILKEFKFTKSLSLDDL